MICQELAWQTRENFFASVCTVKATPQESEPGGKRESLEKGRLNLGVGRLG